MTIWSHIVWDVADDDRVFKALVDPTRRFLLDMLYTRDGRTLTELESELEMTRFSIMERLRILEDAGLVTTHQGGTGEASLPEPGPRIRLISDRSIDEFAPERRIVEADQFQAPR